MKELFKLFAVFAKIGAVMFGGGYAMLPLVTKKFVDELGWATDDEITNYYAIGQCTPGVIAVNVATFIGNKRKGVIGSIFATIGVVFVPAIIITIIAACLSNFAEYQVVKHAFAGVRVCVCVLILNAITRLWKKSVVDIFTFILFAIVFILSALKDYLPFSVSPVILVILCAIIGIVYSIKMGKKTSGGSKQ